MIVKFNLYRNSADYGISNRESYICLSIHTTLEVILMKKIISLLTICFFLFGGNAFAHTGLESSNPSDGSTVTDPIEEITLTFLTKIEQTSSFKIQGPNNKEVPVKDIVVVDDIMTGTVDGMENGEYTLTWNIIGADGHPIQGDLSFTVNLPINENPVELNEEAKTDVEEAAPIVETNEVDNDSSSNGFFIWMIIGLVIILAASIWWINGRNKK